MTYTSLHHYLDIHLGEHSSDVDIKQAKSDYWKWYRTQHRKQRRVEAKSLHLTVSTILWDALNRKASKSKMNVYDFIKRILEDSNEQKPQIQTQLSVAIFTCYELLKDYTENETSIESVLDAMETLIELL